jgi:hypothetical protein
MYSPQLYRLIVLISKVVCSVHRAGIIGSQYTVELFLAVGASYFFAFLILLNQAAQHELAIQRFVPGERWWSINSMFANFESELERHSRSGNWIWSKKSWNVDIEKEGWKLDLCSMLRPAKSSYICPIAPFETAQTSFIRWIKQSL